MKVTKVFMSMNKKRFCKTWNTNIHKTNTQQTDKRTLTNILSMNKKWFFKTWNTNIHKTNTQQTDKRTLTNILHFNKKPEQKF